MKRTLLPTKRPYDSKVFWVLLGLNIPAAFAIIPFALNFQAAYGPPREDSASWGPLLVDRLVTIALTALLAAIGLSLANRIGLGLPFFESRLKGEPPPIRFRGLLALGALTGIGSALLISALDFGVFTSPMLSLLQELGLKSPEVTAASPLHGFLAAISAGVGEETIFRLFGLSLVAWLGGLLIHSEDGRPRPAVFWLANLLAAIVFGAAHLSAAVAIGWPLNSLVLSRTFLLNGIAGLAFGWLFLTYGLESAMLAHFFTDLGLYTLLPVIALQKGTTAKAIAGAGVAVVVALGMVWAGRTIAREPPLSDSESEPSP